MGFGADMNEDGSIIILGGQFPFYFDGVTEIYTGNKNVGWKLKQSITGENGGQHGRTCKINNKGDVIVLGGNGVDNSILIYTGNTQNNWQFAQKITGSVPSAGFGQDISIDSSANTIIVGYGNTATYPDNNGWVSIYTGNPQNKWDLFQIISGKNENDEFGHSTAINNTNTIGVISFGEEYPSYNGTYYILNKTNVKGLPSVDPASLINTNELLFNIPNPKTREDGQVSAFNPGEITFQMTGAFGFNNIDLKVQDFSLSIDLNRSPLKKLGKQYPFFREFNFPIKANIEINCLVGDLESNNLTSLICGKSDYDFDITFNRPCNQRGINLKYEFKKAKLVSQNFSSDIGNNSSMNATYEIDLSDITNFNQGIYIYNTVV
jgi:hypothetical protein